MGYIITIICMLIAIFAYKVEKNWYNPATVFFSIWAVVLFLYSLKLYGIYDVDGTTYVTITLGLFCFFIGYMVGAARKRQTVLIQRNHNQVKEYINYRLLKICGVLVFSFFAEEAIETLVLVNSGISLFDIRTSLQGYAEYSFSDNLYVLRSMIGPLYTWAILPIYNAMLIISCIDFFAGKNDKILILMSVGCLLLKSFKEGSRVALFAFMIYLLFAMMIYGKKIVLSKKTKKLIHWVILAAILIIFVISNIRISTGEKTFFEEIYLYFTCCIPLWDHWFSEMIAKGTDYTYGATSLYGILQLPVAVLSILNGSKLEWYQAGQQAIQDTEMFIQVRNASYSFRSNAYTTMFYYFYKDAGVMGIILGGTLFGGVCTSVYKRMKKGIKVGLKSERQVFVYLLLLQAMVLSFVRVYFSVASYSFTFLYAFVFIRKKYARDGDGEK